MKNKFTVGLFALFALLATSCDKDGDRSEVRSYTYPSYNLYTSIDGSVQPSIGFGSYVFTFAFPANTVAVKTSSFPAPQGSQISFNTDDLPLEGSSVKIGDYNYEVIGFNATSVPSTSSRVKNISGELTQAAYPPPALVAVPGYPRIMQNETAHFVKMNYTLSDFWRVRTFWRDMTFSGSTTTSYPGMQAPYSTESISYRVVMNLDNPTGAFTADVIFYNAMFAPNMPSLSAIVIKDLALEFTQNGYTVSGQNIVPSMLEGQELLENPTYTFDDFRMNVGGDYMQQCDIDYTVGHMFSGSFTGKCYAE